MALKRLGPIFNATKTTLSFFTPQVGYAESRDWRLFSFALPKLILANPSIVLSFLTSMLATAWHGLSSTS